MVSAAPERSMDRGDRSPAREIQFRRGSAASHGNQRRTDAHQQRSGHSHIMVRDGKSGKHRATVPPEMLVPFLQEHLHRAEYL